VQHLPPRIKDASLGDRHAETPAAVGKGRAVRVFSLRAGATGVGLVALSLALSLGQTSRATDLIQSDRGFPPSSSLPTASSDSINGGIEHQDGRFWCRWVLRGHKRPHAFPKLAPANDPNDDETSDDPNDNDDAWDDLTAFGETSTPSFAWSQETIPFLIALTFPPPAFAATHSSSLHLTLQRLRC
jgi:hypothetical protein